MTICHGSAATLPPSPAAILSSNGLPDSVSSLVGPWSPWGGAASMRDHEVELTSKCILPVAGTFDRISVQPMFPRTGARACTRGVSGHDARKPHVIA
jgi:hypothetical protein